MKPFDWALAVAVSLLFALLGTLIGVAVQHGASHDELSRLFDEALGEHHDTTESRLTALDAALMEHHRRQPGAVGFAGGGSDYSRVDKPSIYDRIIDALEAGDAEAGYAGVMMRGALGHVMGDDPFVCVDADKWNRIAGGLSDGWYHADDALVAIREATADTTDC